MTRPALVITPLVLHRRDFRRKLCNIAREAAIILGIMCALGPLALVSKAQSYQTALGVPPFMTALPAESGSIDAATGDLHIAIPLGTFPQRGLPPLTATLVYDSAIWIPSGGVWQTTGTGVGGGGTLLGGGWRIIISGTPSGGIPLLVNVAWTTCSGGSIATESPWSWNSADGTTHIFPINIVYTTGTCTGAVSTGDAFATDSSGYHMFITSAGTKVYAADGSLAYNDTGTGPETSDTNGNYYSGFPNVADSLGRTPFTIAATGCASGATWCINVLNSTGGTSQYNIQTATINMHTSFGVSGITECSTSCSMTVVTGITLPDTTTYAFTYDSGTTAPNYGMLASMTLPTGATINYTFSNFADAYGNKSRWIASRNNGSANWTYSPSVISTCTSTSVGCQQKMTVTQPSLDQQVYTFELDNGDWPIQMQSYNGSASSGTLLATQATTWDFTHSCTTPTGCIGHFYITKLSDTTTLPMPGGSNLNRTTQYTYDTSTNDGNITTVKEWKFYPGSLPSSPDRVTNITYLNGSSYLAVNIMNRPASVIVTDGGGSSQFSKILYSYDATSPGLTSATGAVNHDDTNYGTSYTTRGNLTQVQKWISGTSYLTSSFVYDTTGQVVSATDPAGNTTTLGYADSFYNDASTSTNYTPSSSTHAYLTQVTQPTVGSNSFVSHFSYYYGTGQIARATDVNGQVSNAHYLDPFSRPTSSVPSVGWSLTSYTSATQVDSYTAVSDTTPSTSCTGCIHSRVDLDTLGRPHLSRVMNNPDGVTDAQTNYDSNGRAYNVTAPYFSTGSATAADTTAFDGLDRPTSVTHADGSSSYAYYGPAATTAGGNGTQQCATSTCGYGYPVLSVDEAGKVHETWTDGFGRLIEVDEPVGAPSGGTGSGTANGSEQFHPATGNASGHGTVTISGSEQSVDDGDYEWVCDLWGCGGECDHQTYQWVPYWVYDTGDVSITVNGSTKTVTYGSSSTASGIASALTAAINGDSSYPVSATLSGAVITLTAKTTGFSTNYSLSSTSWLTAYGFGSVSFGESSSGSALTGGTSTSSNTYDAGTVTITVNGYPDTVSYGSGDTSSTVASALTAAITTDSSASVNASVSGTTITLTAKTTGSGTDYSLSSSSTTSYPTFFCHLLLRFQFPVRL